MGTKQRAECIERSLTDWEYLKTLFPEGWEAMARTCGAFQRRRKFSSPEALLRTILAHILLGYSIRVTKAWARWSGVADISAVEILLRMRQCREWLCWMTTALLASWGLPELYGKRCGLRVRIVDATTVTERGSRGTNWRYHFSLDLPDLRAGDVMLTDQHTGESFKNFPIAPGTVLVGDQAYGVAPGIEYVVEKGGDVIVRMNPRNLIARTLSGEPFALREQLRQLPDGAVCDWPVWVQGKRRKIQGSICAQRKPPEAAAKAEKAVIRNSRKKGHAVQPETIEYAHYLIVFTTLPEALASGELVLTLYRMRWQIEVGFHRLKELLTVRVVPHTNPESAQAWLQGKLFGAFLVETLRRNAERFSPEGHSDVGNEPATMSVA